MFQLGNRPSDREVASFFHHLTLVIGTTDLVSKGVCHLPSDDFVIDLEHLLPGSQSKVPEPMISGQTLVPHVLEVVVQGVLMDVLILPASRTEEHVFILSVELPQLTKHLYQRRSQGNLMRLTRLHPISMNLPQVLLHVELLPASRRK